MYVPPSGLLGRAKKTKVSAFNKKFKNTPLRMGVIINCHEKDDKKSLSKLVPEYDVLTSELNEGAGTSYVKYLNCISTDTFGGVADFFEYKLRPSKEDFEKTHNFAKQDGAMVLLLCLDGNAESAIIIGGVKNTAGDGKTEERESNLTKKNGLHLEGEYNGLNWQVNKDGEFTLTFKSKTDIKGKPQDEKAGGTIFKVDKTGSVDIDTNNEASFKLDKTKKDAILNVGNNSTVTATKNVETTAGGDIKGTAKGMIDFAAEGSAKLTSKSMVDIEGKSAVNVKGGDILMKADNGVEVKATQVLIDAPTVVVGVGATPAVISTTVFMGFSPFFGIPVFVNAIGPFSASVAIGS
tara:strand:- start:13557 stop:14609 length:1053 start_codon:yes stop_codon:yes gene_type:complete